MTKQMRCGGIVVLIWLVGGCGTSDIMPESAVETTLGKGWRLADASKVSDGGDVVSQVGYAATGWLAATVPGTVLSSLVNDGIYPEPLYGENDRPGVIPDSLCRTSYWYRTQFTPPAEFAGQHVWLNLAGINF